MQFFSLKASEEKIAHKNNKYMLLNCTTLVGILNLDAETPVQTCSLVSLFEATSRTCTVALFNHSPPPTLSPGQCCSDLRGDNDAHLRVSQGCKRTLLQREKATGGHVFTFYIWSTIRIKKSRQPTMKYKKKKKKLRPTKYAGDQTSPDNRQRRKSPVTAMTLCNRKEEKRWIRLCFFSAKNTGTHIVRYVLSHILIQLHLHTLFFLRASLCSH